MRNGSQLRAQVRFRIPPDTDAHLSDIAGPALTPTRTFARFDRKGRRDIPQSRLFDHLVGAGKQRGRHGEVERLGGFEVDRQVERCGLLHWQVGWLHPSEDFVHVDRGASVQFRRIGAHRSKEPPPPSTISACRPEQFGCRIERRRIVNDVGSHPYESTRGETNEHIVE